MTIPARKLVEAHGDGKLAQLHMVLLMMMDDFARICDQHDLTWIAMYGTAIGALRHKGFIPWDDDIDICMPREDLERFCQVILADPLGKYKIVNSDTCKNYPLATTRFILKGTEFRDSNLATMDFDSGIFLDLFALDNLADEDKAFRKQAFNTWFYNKLAIARDVPNPYIAPGGLKSHLMRGATKTAHALLNLPGIRNVDFAKISKDHATQYRREDTKRVGYLCDTNRFSCTYLVEDLYPVSWVPFEDIQVPIAHNAEKLLEEFYGDWQTPPPLDLRHEHYPDILDFGAYEPVIEGAADQDEARSVQISASSKDEATQQKAGLK